MPASRPHIGIPGSNAQKLPRTVIGLGFVSLFTDVSSEAIFPLLPAFLVTLGSSAAFIGLIEGIAELVSNTLKYFVGRFSDRCRRLKPVIMAGYGLSTFVRPLVAFATAPWHVLLVRSGDRIGKGVRTTPRDTLIAVVTDSSMRGRAYGFHRAMDHAGAAIGTLLAAALLWLHGVTAGNTVQNAARMRNVFLWAALPGMVAMIALALTPESSHRIAALDAAVARKGVPRSVKRALLPLTVFAFANATDAFLLVQAARLGAAASLAPVLWLIMHIVRAASGTAGGRLSDKVGRRDALVLGWCFYGVMWAAIGWADNLPALFALSAVYANADGLVDAAQRGLIADLSAGQKRGAAFGSYNLLIGTASLIASTAFGAVLDLWGGFAAFTGSSVFAFAAAGLLVYLVPRQPERQAAIADPTH